MILFCISLVLLLAYSILMAYYYWSWNQIAEFNTDDLQDWQPVEKVSVIIPARNEEGHIGQCLDSILKQTYPSHLLEIIVIDDHSSDRSAAIVETYANRGVRLLSLSKKIAGEPGLVAYKKKAIELGIDQSTGELIITTDADCTVPPGWISTLAAYHASSRSIFIVAPVKINSYQSLLSFFQTLDFAVLQGITAASVSRNFHDMCNGANLAYEKKAFQEVDGFGGIDHIASGDDMLLMHKMRKRFSRGIGYLKSANAIVETEPAIGWKAFLHQRIRWASKARVYKDRKTIPVLALVYLLNLSLFLLLAGSLLYPHWLLYFGILVFYKILAEWWFTESVLRYFQLRKLLIWFPVFQPLHIIYTVIAGLLGLKGNYQWKGRGVR